MWIRGQIAYSFPLREGALRLTVLGLSTNLPRQMVNMYDYETSILSPEDMNIEFLKSHIPLALDYFREKARVDMAFLPWEVPEHEARRVYADNGLAALENGVFVNG